MSGFSAPYGESRLSGSHTHARPSAMSTPSAGIRLGWCLISSPMVASIAHWILSQNSAGHVAVTDAVRAPAAAPSTISAERAVAPHQPPPTTAAASSRMPRSVRELTARRSKKHRAKALQCSAIARSARSRAFVRAVAA